MATSVILLIDNNNGYQLVRVLHAYSKHCVGGFLPLKLWSEAVRSKRPRGERPTRPKQAKQLREDEISALISHYNKVRNIRQVAREFGISRGTAAKHLAERGIDTSHSMKPADVDAAVALYAEGLSTIKIGERLGFNNHTVLAELRKRGVAIRTALGK